MRDEAKADLEKSILQLLEDAHEEILNGERSAEENFKHAFKRFASLQARAARAAERQANWIIGLTIALFVLTTILAEPAMVSFAQSLISLFSKMTRNS